MGAKMLDSREEARVGLAPATVRTGAFGQSASSRSNRSSRERLTCRWQFTPEGLTCTWSSVRSGSDFITLVADQSAGN